MSPTYERLGNTTQATQDIYGILLKEYRHLSHFHNTILDGWFEYSLKRLSSKTGMFQSELKPHLKYLRKQKIIEQKAQGITTYFRLAETME